MKKRNKITKKSGVLNGLSAATPPISDTPLLRWGDKRAVAQMVGLKGKKWVEDRMREGLPHIKLGPRRTRFDLLECAIWLKSHYGVTQRRGKFKNDKLKNQP